MKNFKIVVCVLSLVMLVTGALAMESFGSAGQHNSRKRSEVPLTNKCMVCYEPLDDEHESVKRLRCGHGFHNRCLNTWFNRHNHCPTCEYECDEYDSQDVVGPVCAICHEMIDSDQMAENRDFFTTDCNHKFHDICFFQWIAANSTCPKCKKIIVEQDLVNEVVTGSAERLSQLIGKHDRSYQGVSLALVMAAIVGNEAAAKVLIEAPEITQDGMRNAAECAAENGHLGVMNIICDSRKVRITHICSALVLAAQNGQVNIVERLLQDSRIPCDIVDEALASAAYHGHKEAFWALYADSRSTGEGMADAVQIAFERGYIADFGFVVTQDEISDMSE
jgi:hypothetical protein